MTASEIRQQFLDFFRERSHTIVPSAPVVPHDDPTLLFTNAGMNQFKDVFLGTGSRSYVRAADTQKCIRAGGKHNDLDDVGADTYHHTFFEMLGNWSFGDYFKKEAIEWAWELLTKVWGVDKSRLHATYFEGNPDQGLEPDHEARDLWSQVTDIDPANVHPGDMKDNFWEMGEVGPCGPCSEVHVDLTPDKTGGPLVNAGDHRVIEIWNLVFIQYSRAADRKLTPLPAKHVDTGMGFERLCAVLNGKQSNYDTDVWTPIFNAIQQRTGAPDYRGTLSNESQSGPEGTSESEARNSEPETRNSQLMIDVSYRVIADHVRCLTFALTDGAVPSNEGRGYVLRRILRRAVRYGRQYFDVHEPFLCDLVNPLVDHMAEAYPELRSAHGGKNVEHVTELIRDEEESFGRTLDRGIRLFDDEHRNALVNTLCRPSGSGKSRVASVTVEKATGAWSLSITEQYGSLAQPSVIYNPEQLTAVVLDEIYERRPSISAHAAFTLHDTYGFPIDLTEIMAAEEGLRVDTDGFEELMNEARWRAREGGRATELDPRTWAPEMFSGCGTTDDSPKYEADGLTETVTEVIRYAPPFFRAKEEPLKKGEAAMLVFRRTCFYAEAGGQIGDRGVISRSSAVFEVQDTQRVLDVIIHSGVLTDGELRVGDEVELRVDTARWSTMKNHTATHMLNWALREVLGAGVQQKGSLVDHEKTRFDFANNKPLTVDAITRIEELVNQQIEAEHPVYTKEVDQAKAREINTLRAVFGEKYPDTVRVVSVGADIDAMLADPQNDKWMKYPVEFCGGTHLKNSKEAERFALVTEEAVAKGIRRVVGVTGEAARAAERAGEELTAELKALASDEVDLSAKLSNFQSRLKDLNIPARLRHTFRDRIADLQQRVKQQQKVQSAASGDAVMERMAELLEEAETIGGVTVVVGEVPAAKADALRGAVDWVRNKTEASVVLLATVSDDRVTLIAGMSKAVVKRGVKAGDLIKEVAPIV
ncbi:MAG: alanine--tRNA ligase, partial [bacterium]|nr:alanine--tRNA ligase [bacterium]